MLIVEARAFHLLKSPDQRMLVLNELHADLHDAGQKDDKRKHTGEEVGKIIHAG